MKTKTFFLGAMVLGSIGLGAVITPAVAAPVNIVLDTPAASALSGLTTISARRHMRRHVVRQQRRSLRHQRRNHRVHRNYVFGGYGIVAAKETSCSFYYRKAMTTGYRYWGVKYNHSCM